MNTRIKGLVPGVLVLIMPSAGPIYGQRPEAASGSPLQGAWASKTVSAAELEHPLSRKGRKLIDKAQGDLKAGRIAEGIEDLNRASKERSAVPYVHSMLGETYLRTGRVKEALPELETAVQLLPMAANYSNLGLAHCLSGDCEQGEAEIRRALKLNSMASQPRYLMGVLQLDVKPPDHEACDDLSMAQREIPAAGLALAVCYVRAGEPVAADRQIRKFAGAGNDAQVAIWTRWVSIVAGEPRPSTAFGFTADSK